MNGSASTLEDDGFALDAGRAREGFDRASAGYDAVAVLQTAVRGELLQRLEFASLEPRLIVDAGCGTAHTARALKRRYRQARVVALDASAGMLRVARAQSSWRHPLERVCADAARLPLADASVDLIVSNLMLHWCEPDSVFAEFRRVLAPHGLLHFSSLGPDTLHELRAVWAGIDSAVHVHRFIDMHDLGDALVRSGFAAPVLDVERYTLVYTDFAALTRDLRAAGARNAARGRPRGLTGRGRLAAVIAGYEAWRRDGRLPATCEVVYGQAWTPAPAPGALGAGRDGAAVRIPLGEVAAQLPGRRR